MSTNYVHIQSIGNTIIIANYVNSYYITHGRPPISIKIGVIGSILNITNSLSVKQKIRLPPVIRANQ